MKLFQFLMIAIGLLSAAQAQELTQDIQGRITDRLSQLPVIGARVQVDGQGSEAKTDTLGRFRLAAVKVGRLTLTVEKPGYETLVVPDLILNAGKVLAVELSLEPRAFDIGEVSIIADQRRIDAISTRSFSVEETQRFAATYFDPARLTMSFPGVVQNNDQGNQIIVRGNSPNGVLWRLEGVDIVNPNHLTNTGTFSDRATLTGGGQIILSTQLLDRSEFLNGAFSAGYGNALAGVFDMRLRQGNTQAHEYTLQAGLIGTDLAAEGPLGQESQGSFLANYRYSTVGLLSAMGIPLGDEEISFQDFSFNLYLPTKKAGTFTLFGLGGLSSNRFEAQGDSAEREEQKDLFDIDFTSDMGALGLTHEMTLGSQTFWRSAAALSGIRSTRSATFQGQVPLVLDDTEDEISEGKLSFNTQLTHTLSNRLYLTGGLFVNHTQYKVDNRRIDPLSSQNETVIARASGSAQLVQPFARLNLRLTPAFSLEGGLHGMYFTLNGRSALEPRASIQWNPGRNTRIGLAYGLHSQVQLPGTYFSTFRGDSGEELRPNEDLDFTRAHHLVLSLYQRLGDHLHLRVEPYYQALFDVPIVNRPGRSFSVLNLVEGYVTDTLENAGTGENAGVDVSLEKVLSKDYYYLLSASFYNAQYTGGDGVLRDTRFNGRYAASLTGGKAFDRSRADKGKNRSLGLHGRVIYRGGLRETPIDLAASQAAGETVFIESQAYSQQLADYFRIDLRISWRRNKEKYTRVFAIDIQNLTNQQNIAFRTFDALTGEITTKYQLGIIPLLSYRIEF